MLFLTQEELVALTGMKRNSSQIEALHRMKIPFLVNLAGRPVVESRNFQNTTAPATAATWEPSSHRPIAPRAFRTEGGRFGT